jgi:DNA-binding GntR family transcriptional regulator
MALERLDAAEGSDAGRTLRERLVAVLRTAILEATLLPGTRLVEAKLAERLGVSRGPLREAIAQLLEEGLLAQVPYRGTVVQTLSVEDVRQSHSFRVLLESFAFELLWEKRTPEFFRALDARHRALGYALYGGDPQEAIRRELDLHGLACEFSGHRPLLEAWTTLRGRLHLYLSLHHRAHGRAGARADAHDAYVACAKGDDLAAMRAEIERHLRRGADALEAFVVRRGRLPRGTGREAAEPAQDCRRDVVDAGEAGGDRAPAWRRRA